MSLLNEWDNPDEITQRVSDFDKKLKQLGIKRVAKYKAKISGEGNVKLGRMGSFSKLYGDKSVDTQGAFGSDYVDTKDVENKESYKKLATLVGSCGHHCDGCKDACYVATSYRYPTVVIGHARNSQALKDLDTAFYDLDKHLTNKRKKYDIVRIHQSGEFESEDEVRMWCDLAKRHPETLFYVYTKAYEFIDTPLSEGYVPENFHILISVWKNIGVSEFRKFEDYSNIKAFACISKDKDGKPYDYEKEQNLKITSYCRAYDEEGHLNHDITCTACKKCFSDIGGKVVGCYEH